MQRLGQIQQSTTRTLTELIIGLDQVEGFFAGKHLAALAGRLLALDGLFQAVVEIADGRFQRLGQLPQAGGRDAVGTAFIFLDLLEADPDLGSQLLLSQAQKTPTTAQTAAQVKVDIGGHGPISPCWWAVPKRDGSPFKWQAPCRAPVTGDCQ